MPVPLAPSNLAISSYSSQSVNLTWQDNSSDETGFTLERRYKTSTGNWSSWVPVAVDANFAFASINLLLPKTIYQFRVNASNSSGVSGYSNVVEQQLFGLYGKMFTDASAKGVDDCEVQIWYPPDDGTFMAGDLIARITGAKFQDTLELNPDTGQQEAVIFVELPVTGGPVLQTGDEIRMYVVALPGGVETFTRIARDPRVIELPPFDVNGTGGGVSSDPLAPTISGAGKVRSQMSYTPGLRSPIEKSWWVVNGKRMYPTDRTFIGTIADFKGRLKAEDVVGGVSYYSSEVILESADLPAAEIVEEFSSEILASDNVNDQPPQPSAPAGLKYRSENIKRLAGGGLAMINNTNYGAAHVSAELDVDSFNHKIKWSSINNNAFWMELQFEATNAEFSLYNGAPNASGLSIKISRGSNTDSWQTQVVKYVNNGGAASESIEESGVSLDAAITEVEISVVRNRLTGACSVTIDPSAGPNVLFNFTDVSVGNWLVGKMGGNAGSGSPVMEIQGGVGNGSDEDQIPVNDIFAELFYRDFTENQNRGIIGPVSSGGVEFIDKPRWYPTVINEEAQDYVSGPDYRGNTPNPSPTKIQHDPFTFDSEGLNISARRATLQERLYINDTSVIHTYATHLERQSLTGFAPPNSQRGWQHRVRVAEDNTFWYMYSTSSPKSGQWKRSGLAWLSGLLSLRGLFSTKYGSFGFRVSGMSGPGVWFALWMLPESGLESAEIDIIETASTRPEERGKVSLNTHLPDENEQVYSSANTRQPSELIEFPAGGGIEDEHYIQCLWEYNRIRWYFDGRLVHSGDNIAFEDMTVLMNLAIANGNDGFQEPFEEEPFETTVVTPPTNDGIMTEAEWLDTIVGDMQFDNDGVGSRTGSGFSGASIKASAYAPTAAALTQMCVGPTVYGRQGGTLHTICDTAVPWSWFWEQSGNQHSDAIIVMGYMEGFILNNQNEWVKVFFDKRGKGYVNGGGFSDLNDEGPDINGQGPQPARGNELTLLKVSQDRPLELWTDPFYTFQNRALMSGFKGWHFRFVAWVEGNDKDLVKWQACQGFDLYEYQSSKPGNQRPPSDYPFRAMDGGHGRYKTLTPVPKFFTATSVGPTKAIVGPRPPWADGYSASDGPNWPWGVVGTDKVMSVQQLIDNPPPMPTFLPTPL